MATKKPAKTTQSKAKSNRGGARPGAGRKPKAVQEFRDELIAGLIAPPPQNDVIPTQSREQSGPTGSSAADRAIRLFEEVMNDDGRYTIDVRLKAAREILDRSVGKPRQAVEIAATDGTGPQIIVYIPSNGRDGAEGAEA